MEITGQLILMNVCIYCVYPQPFRIPNPVEFWISFVQVFMICVERDLVDVLAVVLYVFLYFYDFVVIKGKIVLEPYV
tara:strand:- start:169 stop:399 length:231 start_codon:yes stop_codon:yes gene_type:complete